MFQDQHFRSKLNVLTLQEQLMPFHVTVRHVWQPYVKIIWYVFFWLHLSDSAIHVTCCDWKSWKINLPWDSEKSFAWTRDSLPRPARCQALTRYHRQERQRSALNHRRRMWATVGHKRSYNDQILRPHDVSVFRQRQRLPFMHDNARPYTPI